MKVHSTDLSGAFLLEPKIYNDARGFFLESWNDQLFRQLGINETFVQDNHSLSHQGILRGLHYQFQQPQGKLAWVIEGEVYDVLVDMRKSSPTFGKWQGFYLNAEDKLRLWAPPGFAHGFYVTSKQAQFCYKCTDYYVPESEKVLSWNTPELAISWPIPNGKEPLLSERDKNGLTLQQAPTFS